MRYELSDHEWGVINPMLPNKPRGIPRIDGRRARNLIERFFNKIKQCQRIATRYDKRAINYLAFTWLSSSSPQSAFGYALMSPDPSEIPRTPQHCCSRELTFI
jgi:transposase